MSNLDRPKVKIIGKDGNAFFILGTCKKAADKAKWTKERWDKFKKEATSGDYDNLLRTVMDNFDVE